jgi:hypothetical protein
MAVRMSDLSPCATPSHRPTHIPFVSRIPHSLSHSHSHLTGTLWSWTLSGSWTMTSSCGCYPPSSRWSRGWCRRATGLTGRPSASPPCARPGRWVPTRNGNAPSKPRPGPAWCCFKEGRAAGTQRLVRRDPRLPAAGAPQLPARHHHGAAGAHDARRHPGGRQVGDQTVIQNVTRM